MSILDFNLNDSVKEALARNEARRLETNKNFSDALDNLGEAAKNAYGHYTRRKQMELFGGDEDDGELKAAKDIYIKTGDISQLNAWKQSKENKAQTEAIKAQTKVAEEEAKKKEQRTAYNDAKDDYTEALAAMNDATKGGKEPTEVQKNALATAARKFKDVGGDISEYDGYVDKLVAKDKENEVVGSGLRAFERDLAKATTDDSDIDVESFVKRLDDLHEIGLDTDTYRKYLTEVKLYNKNRAKAIEQSDSEAEQKRRGDIAFAQQQQDRKKAQEKEAEEKAAKEEEEKQKKQAIDDFVESWIKVNGSKPADQQKNSLADVRASTYGEEKVKAIKERGYAKD